MDLNEKHSFAVLAYKESPYLEKCIQSILNQTIRSNIYISTSTPCTHISDVANKYQLTLYIHDEHKDIVSDWNFAIDKCPTSYLTLAHQDDIYYPEYTQKMISAMQRAKNCIISFCDYEEIEREILRTDSRMMKIKRLLLWPYWFKYKYQSRFFKRMILRFGDPVCCPSVVYNLELCTPKFDDSYKGSMDWDAWYRLSNEKGSFVYIKDKLMAHRIHENSETTKLIASADRYEEDLSMFRKFWPEPIARFFADLYKKSYLSNKI